MSEHRRRTVVDLPVRGSVPLASVGALRIRRWAGLDGAGVLAPSCRTRAPHPLPRPSIDDLAELCEIGDLQGRGGSGFPLAVKLRSVHEAARRSGLVPYVVANGAEGEPASAKDRALLTLCPDLVLDGIELVAAALGADRAHAYVADAACRRVLAERGQYGQRRSADVVTFAAETGYVTGEETAAVRALGGGPAKPTAKPPRPYTEGVAGHPTLVSNVETLAQLAALIRRGAAPSDATVLLTVVTDRGDQTLVEIPPTVTLRTVLEDLALWPTSGTPQVILGGFFGAFVTAGAFEIPISHRNLRDAGLTLGCGIVLVLTELCPVRAVAEILRYLDAENAHQCGPCFRGITAMCDGVEALADGTGTDDSVRRLRTWSVSLLGRGACGTLDAAAGLLASLLEQHPDLIGEHLTTRCRTCAENAICAPGTRWAVPWPAEFPADLMESQ